MSKKLMAIMLITIVSLGFVGCQGNVEEENPTDEVVQQEIAEEKENEKENITETEEEKIYYVLYLKHRSMPYIFADTYSIKGNDPKLQDKSLELFVMEELIQQEGVGELINSIPQNTEVLSVDRENDTVIVNLSQEFIEDMKGTEQDVEATVAMIVNSLTTIPGNNYVKILVEGNSVTNLRGVNISGSYKFIEDFYLDK
ncbi:MAG: GerMN domain-containing protein [Clostridiaceae bacterium]|nr:GerMN domain-containing protein [Clostridiaceae bacterium]